MIRAEGHEVAIVAITKNGADLARRLHPLVEGSHLYVPAKLSVSNELPRHPSSYPGPRPEGEGDVGSSFSREEGQGEGVNPYPGTATQLIQHIFPRYRHLVLFLALGAAVRIIAPLLKDKRTDPAVVVVDELGKFAISALSGHIGGANDLAQRVAQIIGAQPVITTASDVLGILSADLVGRDLGWTVENERALTKVSSALVDGERVGLYQDSGERGWYPSDKSWPANLEIVGDLLALSRPCFAAGLVVTDRVLSEEHEGLLEKCVLYRPRSLVLGVGCNRGTARSEIEEAVLFVLREVNLSFSSVRNLATIDAKNDEDGLIQFAKRYGLPVSYFSKDKLNAVAGVLSPSDVVYRSVGTWGVCEPAALLSAKTDELVVAKRTIGNVTVAVARIDSEGTPCLAARPSGNSGLVAADTPSKPGTVFVVGLGPGAKEHMTPRARAVLAACDVVVGYKTYVNLLKGLLDGKEVVSSGMRQEVARARKAVELAEAGKNVAVVSSGDAGVYGMAGLMYQVARARGWPSMRNIEVVPGISALNAAAALLGAPLMHDFAVISLSDLLTPWETIARRLEAAGHGDFVVVLYNPKSGRRTSQVEEARRIMLAHRGPATPVGLVTSAYRDRQEVVVTDLEHMLDFDIGMLTTIVVGNSTTTSFDGVMVTPRGYQNKYELGDEASDGDS